MNDILNSIGNFIPAKYLPLVALLPLVGRSYDALKNGGGLKGLWRAIWLGRSTPEAPKQTTDTTKP